METRYIDIRTASYITDEGLRAVETSHIDICTASCVTCEELSAVGTSHIDIRTAFPRHTWNYKRKILNRRKQPRGLQPQKGSPMAKTKELKTNAMRILDKNKISYEVTTYPCEEFIDGIHVADLLGLPYERCFKTLVAAGKSGNYHVFVLPVDRELDMKAAARAAGEKNVELIPVKDITAVTGYVRGGCTAIGMKKNYPVILQKTAADFDTIAVSGGHLGVQITLSPSDLIRVTRGIYADIVQ